MPSNPVRQILAAYPVVHHALRQREVAAEAAGRLSLHQATVLAHLDRAASHTLSELATEVGVALPTMSLLVERLVRGGFITRERDPADGRRVALRLSPSGVKAVAARSLLDPTRVRAVVGVMTPEERADGVRGLRALASAVRRARLGSGEGVS